MRWKLELACYCFDIVYRPGKSNVAPDTLSRATCAMTSESLYKLHESLCHLGVTRLYHLVRSKNFPYSLEEIRKITSTCRVCNECNGSIAQKKFTSLKLQDRSRDSILTLKVHCRQTIINPLLTSFARSVRESIA